MTAKRRTKKAPLKTSLAVKILIGIFILTAAVGLYFVTPKATPAPPATAINLTETPDYNTCSIITNDDIKNSFNGDLITGISTGLRAGVKAANDTIADSCGYNLTTTKSLNNSLSVQAYPYTAVVDGKNKESVNASWREVAASNPKAYFSKDMEGDTVIYKLRVIPGGKNVMFELRQPMHDIAIDEPSALDFLVGIAAKADFSVIEPAPEL